MTFRNSENHHVFSNSLVISIRMFIIFFFLFSLGYLCYILTYKYIVHNYNQYTKESFACLDLLTKIKKRKGKKLKFTKNLTFFLIKNFINIILAWTRCNFFPKNFTTLKCLLNKNQTLIILKVNQRFNLNPWIFFSPLNFLKLYK